MSDFKKLINANDLIEWIMETYPDWCVGAVRSIVDHVEDMPSAEPEQRWIPVTERVPDKKAEVICSLEPDIDELIITIKRRQKGEEDER